jgi:hypothetical protein
MTTPIHRFTAFNSARGSDNPLHKDDAARSLGYAAGLVPGVDMYAYLTYAPVRKWGARWIQEGSASISLLKPVYEGDVCEILVVHESDAELLAELRCDGSVKAIGTFKMDATGAVQALISAVPPIRPALNPRPAADEVSLAVGTILGTITRTLPTADSPAFLNDMRDDLPLYAKEAVVHPGYLLRMCNWALSQNVVLGPWIHTGSEIQNHATAHLDEALQARPVVRANYMDKGHRWVEAEIVIVGDKDRVISTVRHIAIYEPRPVINK